MGGPEHKSGHHATEHHEHHDVHHDDHHHHEVDPRIKGTPVDFSHKHPVFDINLDKKGP